MKFAWFGVAAAEIAAIALSLYRAFMTPENMSAPAFGTAWAPYSDALGPWLEGALAYFLGIPAPNYLYRPSVGLFYGSILSATERVAAIPASFSLALLALLICGVAFLGDRAMRWGLLFMLAAICLCFESTWATVFIATTAVDFPSLVVTLCGFLLLLGAHRERPASMLIAACACLGLAAAIRGPMMLAGPVAVGLVLWRLRPIPWTVGALLPVAFLAPLVIDVALQRHLGTVNNGVMALYCAYADPTHGWTSECNTQFLASKPGGAEIVRNFIAFSLSADGLSMLLQRLGQRIGTDVRCIYASLTLLALAAVGILAAFDPGDGEAARARRRRKAMIATTVAVVGSLIALRFLASERSSLTVAWLAVAFAAAVLMKDLRSAACLAAYGVGTVYLCLLGLHGDRLQHTFSFTLLLGLGLLVMQSRDVETPSPSTLRLRAGFCAALALTIAFLYTGWSFMPSEMRRTYDAQVRGRGGVAIKLTSDMRIDRDLYLGGRRELFYTRNDGLPIGTVRRFDRLETIATSNASFITPNAFVGP